MIIRTIQLFVKTTNYRYITEVYNHLSKSWSPIEKCHYHYKDAKVRINGGIVFLVGHSIDNEEELSNFTVDFLGQSIDWNDDTIVYKYIEWVDYFSAYY
jgi:hypothetical protein